MPVATHAQQPRPQPVAPISHLPQQDLPSRDFTLEITAIHWTLIGVAALVQDSIRAGGFSGGLSQYFGRIVAIALGACVLVTLIYVFHPSRKQLRLRRVFTIAGWCVVAFLFYPLVRT